MYLVDFLQKILKDSNVDDEHLGNRHKVTLYINVVDDDTIYVDKILVNDKVVEKDV